jgi:hypothetical protein
MQGVATDAGPAAAASLAVDVVALSRTSVITKNHMI